MSVRSSPAKPFRSGGRSVGFVFVAIAAGLFLRLVHVGLPFVLVKYGGSYLWAFMLYWIVAATRPVLRPWAAALTAGIVATAVEFLKLYHSPWLDAFRLTLPGTLLLGRFFSKADLIAYWSAILFCLVLDARCSRLPGEGEL